MRTRRFLVFAGCNHREMDEVTLEFSNGETDAQIEEACADVLDTLIGNNFDTGWNEVTEPEDEDEEQR